MIFDPEIELLNIETQPEWIGVQFKIKQLQERRADLMVKFDKFGNEKILNVVNEVDSDLKLFESILELWIRNHQKLERLYKSFEDSINEINKGAKQLNLINDLKIAYTMEGDMQEVLCNTFIDLCNKKDIDTNNMESTFKKLRAKIKEYWNHMIKEVEK